MEPFRQKGYYMALWNTFTFKGGGGGKQKQIIAV